MITCCESWYILCEQWISLSLVLSHCYSANRAGPSAVENRSELEPSLSLRCGLVPIWLWKSITYCPWASSGYSALLPQPGESVSLNYALCVWRYLIQGVPLPCSLCCISAWSRLKCLRNNTERIPTSNMDEDMPSIHILVCLNADQYTWWLTLNIWVPQIQNLAATPHSEIVLLYRCFYGVQGGERGLCTILF